MPLIGLALTEREGEALAKIAADLELSRSQVLRKALAVYQLIQEGKAELQHKREDRKMAEWPSESQQS